MEDAASGSDLSADGVSFGYEFFSTKGSWMVSKLEKLSSSGSPFPTLFLRCVSSVYISHLFIAAAAVFVVVVLERRLSRLELKIDVLLSQQKVLKLANEVRRN